MEMFLFQPLGQKKGIKHSLNKVNFRIGKADDCEIKTKGWFAPKLAARVVRRNDGFYLEGYSRGKTTLNGISVTEPVRLHDGDRIVVRNVWLEYYARPVKASESSDTKSASDSSSQQNSVNN